MSKIRPFDDEQEDIERAKMLGIYNVPFDGLVKITDERIARIFGIPRSLLGFPVIEVDEPMRPLPVYGGPLIARVGRGERGQDGPPA